MIIDIGKFHGPVPKVDPRLLAPGYAEYAENCDVESGVIESIKGLSPIWPAKSDTETIFKMRESFLEWASEVDVVLSLVNDSDNRIYFTGDEYPKDTNATLALESLPPYPENTRRLGINSPTLPPTITLNGTAGADIVHSSSYVYTIVGKWEDGTEVESGPSPATAVFDVYEGITPRVSAFVDDDADGAFTTHFRIYRLTSGTSGSEYQYVDEIPTTETYFDDDVLDSELSGTLQSEIWAAPGGEMSGLTSTSHGLVFGFIGNEIFPSEVFIPYSFPPNYSLTVESGIIGLGYTGSMVVVLTETVPYLLNGSSPESLELMRLGYQQPCVSSRSIVNIPGGVIYASPDGLYVIDGSGAGSILTGNLFKKEQWKDFDIENLIGVYYDDSYWAFFRDSTEGFRIGLTDGIYQPFSFGNNNKVYGAHYSPESDEMYVIAYNGTGRSIYSVLTGANIEYTWRSAEFFSGSDWITAGMVDSDFVLGDVEFKLYVDGSVVFTKTVTNSDIFMIPIVCGDVFQVEVTGESTINRIMAAQSYEDIVGSL